MKVVPVFLLALLAAGLCAAASVSTAPTSTTKAADSAAAPATASAPSATSDDSGLKSYVESQLEALRKQFQEREGVLQKLEAALNELKNSAKQPSDVSRAVSEAVENAVRTLRTEHGGKITELETSLKSFSQQLESKISSVVADMKKSFEQVKSTAATTDSADKRSFLEQEVASLKQSLQQLQDRLKNQTGASDLFETVKVTVNSLYQWGKQHVLKIWAYIREHLLNKTTMDALNARYEVAQEELLRLFDKSIDFFNKFFLSKPTVQPYASTLALGVTSLLFALPVFGAVWISWTILAMICGRRKPSTTRSGGKAKRPSAKAI